jgi:hypothetical protein
MAAYPHHGLHLCYLNLWLHINIHIHIHMFCIARYLIGNIWSLTGEGNKIGLVIIEFYYSITNQCESFIYLELMIKNTEIF